MRILTALVLGLPLLLSAHRAAWADAAASSPARRSAITARDGKEIYRHVCQGCHMADGKGGIGAATIPGLAGNPKLAAAGYPVSVVLTGMGAMPWFNGVLSDDQIAAVVNYVRTHFGNVYRDAVSAAEVASLKGSPPHLEH